jgi:cytochrome P450
MTTTTTAAGTVNLGDPAFWALPVEQRYEAFRALRDTPGLTFHQAAPFPGMPESPGWYAAVRHDDVVEVSKHPDLYRNGLGDDGIGGIRTFEFPDEFWDVFESMIAMDDPRHARLRRLVSRSFTPRILARAEQSIAEIATEIVERVAPLGGCDLVDEIAAALPLKVICDMMGIPDDQYKFVLDQSNMILGAEDPEFAAQVPDFFTALMGAAHNLFDLVDQLCDERAAHPSEDLTSVLLHAEVDGERLDRQEIWQFFLLLVVAGNETTRNAISHGVRYLTEHPDQRAIWWSDYDAVAPTAVEEIVRFASPVTHMRRTVRQDCELAGQELHEGDKVVMYYPAACRDERAFPEPDRFDVRREPNNHTGFGGPGPHYCLGAHLARREITVMFRELHRRVPDIHTVGQPDILQSDFIYGVKRQACAFTPS